MKSENMVVIDQTAGETVGGKYKSLADTLTRFELYRTFPSVSDNFSNVVAFIQDGLDMQTNHTEKIYGAILCS